MTRISTFGQTQVLLQGLQRNQIRLFEDQQQVNTGKVADKFSGIADKTSALLGAKSLLSKTDSYRSTIQTVLGRLDANDTQLGSILQVSRDFSETILNMLALDQANAFDEILNESFRFIANTLNTNIDGVFIFGGTQTDVPPVSSNDINDLIAAADASDLFQNDDDVLSAQVAEGVETDYGLLASDIAEQLFDSFKRIAEFHNDPVNGPFDGELTAAQRTFLENEFAQLTDAIEQAQSQQVQNGLRSQRLSGIDDQHADTQLFLKNFISNIEDVDMAEAISRLNNDQTALEASFRTFATLADVSLLDFI